MTPSGDDVQLPVITRLTLLLTVAGSATGCAAIGGVFRAGLWTGLILAVLLIALVLFVVRSLGR